MRYVAMNANSCANGYRGFAVDAVEDKDCYQIKAELPGFGEDELEIEIEDDLLTISAKKEAKVDADKEKSEGPQFLIRERSFGELKRSFSLPKDADRESIQANFKNGVLELNLNKKEESKPLSIKINNG